MTCKIALALVDLDTSTLSSLGVKEPKPFYAEDDEQDTLASGHVRNLGLPVVTWGWGFLRLAQRQILRNLWGTDYSKEMYIETQINDDLNSDGQDDWRQFRVIGYWGKENKDARRRMDFSLRFVVLEDVTPT